MYKKQLLKLFFCSLFLLFSGWASAQNVTVSGKVTDEKGLPLPGATISVKQTQNGTNSDVNGKYTISVSKTGVLVFSMVGYSKQEIAVNNRTEINVTLREDNRLLNEVVVVGYGTQKRKDLTGSISSVKGAVFKDQPITNPIEGLQGRISGVNIVENSAAPDAVPQIIIRGLASFYQPNPLYIVDGVRQADLNNVNPQDIASIDVAKDAASAAIYGSAAAGGVILVTTKKGSGIGAPPQINFSARYGFTKPKLVQLLDRDNYIKMENIVNPKFFAGAGRTDTLANTNWVDALYRNGTEQNYALSITGASANVNYLASGFYNQQTGIFIKNYSNIGGARVNTDYKLSKYITIGEQINASQRITSPLVGAQADLHNAPFRTQPIIPIYNKDGSYGTEPSGYNGLQFSGPNPLGAVNSAMAQNTKNNFQGNAYADIKLPLHLDFKTTLGYSYYNETQDFFQNTYNFGSVASAVNSLSKSYAQSSQLLTNYVLSYNQSIGKHNINALVGYEQIVNKTNNIYSGESQIGIPGYSYVQTSASALSLSGTYDPQSLIKSQFARVNYNYNERYYLSASIRQDANYTQFGPDKVKGVFPAVSAGWTISEEPSFKKILPVFNSLKLRASYGQLGNSTGFPPYFFTSNYSQFNLSTGIAGGAQGFAPGQPFQIANSLNSIPNPALHWETITETSVGLDGEALDGALYFTVEWYNKKTSDLIYALSLPQSTGFTQSYITNIGDVSNKGFDLMVGYHNKIGKLGFDISANASFNKNKVTKLSGAATDAVYGGYNFYGMGDIGFNTMSNQQLTITKAGQPFGQFYGYKALGIFNSQDEAQKQVVNGNKANIGDLQFQDLNGDGKIDVNDRQVIGNPNPKMVYGFNIRLNYGGFDLAALFNGVAGVDLFNGVKSYEQYPFADGNTTSQIFKDSFFGSNGLTSQPRVGVPSGNAFVLDPNKNYTSVNSYFVESGAYLKLKNLQLGYTFSGNVLQRISVKSLRVFVMANNVFTITKYKGLDPELGSAFTTGGAINPTTQGIDAVTNYPQARIFSAGVNVSL
ncbi:SusC/RagA family TonB-linked outer membrane protein [Mucilaginibacter sp. OK098]|uniref:SusC/RagA family TonB-linked outer membrane protein n=1 Tax=Mucilaginibacter sp. OK098 TaxID=1855297 RepID=UPI0009111B7A|nr:TonB-dependent receptor [Mucilaginibacter sp. OK098]SHM22628.1 TonB-linked outer membrane protein, SusC/RagA family [Mucilaginibacter sp. OK098]